MSDDSRMFVIWSFEHNAWWAPAEQGYTEQLERAGRYDAATAGRIVIDSVWLEEVAILEQIADAYGAPRYHPYLGNTYDRTNFRPAR